MNTNNQASPEKTYFDDIEEWANDMARLHEAIGLVHEALFEQFVNVVEEGFTEIFVHNPTTMETRQLYLSVEGRRRKI